MKCQYCGRDEAIPFKCQYCQGFFCAEHRLPENHACPESWRTRAFHEEAPQPQPQPMKEGKAPFEYTVTYTPFGLKKPRRFWFSRTELEHLVISALLVMAVGASGLFFVGAPLMILMSAAIIFALIFLSHEIAHKLVAQHYGLWAEFRLTMFGALITLISIISPLKLISPGAVMIAGSANKESVGKTAISGPTVNIVLSIVSFAFTFILQDLFLLVALFSAYISAFIAVFNLIPVGVLDGWKVFHWSKLIWGIAFSLSLALLIMIFVMYPDLFSIF